jgi:hypothetical protein
MVGRYGWTDSTDNIVAAVLSLWPFWTIEEEVKDMIPLDGIKVLEFSHFMPGPFCSMMLADFGAEVLRGGPCRHPKMGEPEQAKGTVVDVNAASSQDAHFRSVFNLLRQNILILSPHVIYVDISRSGVVR